MSIYIWEWKYSYEAMQWPCPSGFHIPRQSEWEWLETIMDWLNLSNWEDWGNYLKLPFAWYIDYEAPEWIMDIEYFGYYWSCNTDSSDARSIWFSDNNSTVDNDSTDRWWGYSVRAFKDNFVTPSSWWTVITGTLWSAGIFRNQTDWIISITSNWSTGYTIADKNVWATVVYSYWDTLDDSNCGKYFQWGNNYWFTWDTITTTSSTAVDTTWYWPWNYYSSSTFITWNSDWSNPSNDNLRWWVTGIIKLPNVSKIYIWEWGWDDYSAMQWPCPVWYHVPTNTEWAWLRTIMVWLSLSSWNNFKINLHLPFAWHLRQGDWTLPADDDKGYYFASTTSWTGAYRMYLTTSSSNAAGTWSRASGYSVRAFKDTFEVPNSNWTVINGTLWNAGIFRNQTDWIISITSDWSTGYTIMDKNLWATTVYSNWDTLSQANCGYFFQRWNNNWFPRTWATTTSSTAIDTIGYWPWNYYNNGTFITITWDWSNPANDNLWWWVTGITKIPNVREVYKWTTKIRPV